MNVFLAAHQWSQVFDCAWFSYLLHMHIIYVAIEAPACSYGWCMRREHSARLALLVRNTQTWREQRNSARPTIFLTSSNNHCKNSHKLFFLYNSVTQKEESVLHRYIKYVCMYTRRSLYTLFFYIKIKRIYFKLCAAGYTYSLRSW